MPVHLRALRVAALFLGVGSASAAAQGAAAPSLIITPRELSRELKDPALVILHVGTKENYDAGHIEGARFVQLEDMAVGRGPGELSLELPPEAALRASLEKFGIGDRSKVVVTFGEDWGSPSTRIVFTLQAAGLERNTRWLDGGTWGWQAAGLPLTKDAPRAATPGTLTLPAHRDIVADNAWVQAHLKAPHAKIIDARAPVFYEGPPMRDHPVGHIPGAVSLPFTSLTTDSIQMLPIDKLRQAFAGAGIQPGDTLGVYCHIGQQGTMVVFAARLLGFPVKLYDGSMDDWERRKLPLENARAGKAPEAPASPEAGDMSVMPRATGGGRGAP